MGSSANTGIDYSELHRIDSPANRALRVDLWRQGDDLGQHSFVTPAYFRAYAQRLGMGPGIRVLDVGSGTGGPAIYMAEVSGCDMTGLEVNEVGIEVANRLAANTTVQDRVRFVQADGMQMPFEDASFDIVISMNVMNVFEDKVGLFREVRRVLRPGGTWAFLSGTFDFGPEDDDVRDRLARGYAIPQYTDTLAGYKAKLREAGFVVDEVVEYLSDFRETMQRWLDAWIKHRDAIAEEQGAEQTDYHIVYFTSYLEMIDAGKASNHFVISTRPDD
ncbi:MAG: methyltransferase domain-containing protein [Actinobacteria bacterium]|nr:methyltransferase domain-containing protein [Actinomycetota bacterium]